MSIFLFLTTEPLLSDIWNGWNLQDVLNMIVISFHFFRISGLEMHILCVDIIFCCLLSIQVNNGATGIVYSLWSFCQMGRQIIKVRLILDSLERWVQFPFDKFWCKELKWVVPHHIFLSVTQDFFPSMKHMFLYEFPWKVFESSVMLGWATVPSLLTGAPVKCAFIFVNIW